MGSKPEEAHKPHAVLVPFPAQGHVNPFMQLAKLLHARGFHVTFVNTEFNHRRLIRSRGPESVQGLSDFRFETIPDGLPPSDRDATQDVPSICSSMQKNGLAGLSKLIGELISSPDVPPVSCIVSDGVASFGIKAAQQFGIPEVQFWTASACGFMAYLSFQGFIERGIFPFKDESFLTDGTLEKQIDWIPGMPNIRIKDVPSFIRSTDPDDILFNFLKTEAENTLGAPSIIFNTFHELEDQVLERIRTLHPRIYTAGSLSLLGRHLPESESGSLSTNLWKEDTKCVGWLDKREPNSVVYVNYGSVTTMSDQHFQEFAWGLANSKHPFLWIVRPDIVQGESALLPQEFLDEIKDRGMLTTWCQQEEVLNHPSVGAFLTHCGWNSTLESISAGVPVICWPFFCEQQTNCRYLCSVWGTGMEVNQDVKRHEISGLVKQVLEGKKGEEMRKNAKEWKRKAEAASAVGGSSYINFDRFVEEALHSG